MIVAIPAGRADSGLFLGNNGYEFGLALLSAAASLAISGAGPASLDGLLAGAGN